MKPRINFVLLFSDHHLAKSANGQALEERSSYIRIYTGQYPRIQVHHLASDWGVYVSARK